MAASQINTECKRYGCMKNLLACYANCRYNTRCDELRGEILSKTDEAARDINSYLTERGRAPITIQFLKRGLKFSESIGPKTEKVKSAPKLAKVKAPGKVRKQAVMAKKINRVTSTKPAEADQPAAGSTNGNRAVANKPARKKRRTASAPPAPRQGKTFIILEGKSASLVDELGLMQHIMSGAAEDARYFEATEVEARLHITRK